MVDEAPEATHVRGHHRGPAGRGLEGHQAEGLRPAGHQADVGGPVVGGEQLVGLGRHEHDPVLEAGPLHQGRQPLHLGLALRAARAAHDDQPGVGMVGPQVIQGADGHRHPLEGLDPADEEEQAARFGQGQGPPGLAPGRPGPKKAWSTPGATIRIREGSAW